MAKNKTCAWPSCNKPARRRFCSNKHKDDYHNAMNPRGRTAYRNPSSPDYDPSRDHMDSIHPFSSEGLGQWDD